MMNDAAKEYNGKNTCTNKVCNSFWFGGSWNLVILNFRARMGGGGGGGGGGWGGGERGKKKKYFLGDCPIMEVFLSERLPYWLSIQIGNARLQIFSNAMMRQLLLHSISISYLASKIFHFFLQQIKESTQLLI